VSDEGIGEAGKIYGIINRLVRARYRTETGVTEKAQKAVVR
jgi:hypothetical protein